MALPTEKAKPSWILTLASIAIVIAAVYLAKGVLVPLTLAVLLSFLLSPLCDWLERRGLGRIPAVLLTAFLGFTVLGIATWTATDQMTRLAPKIPEYQQNLEAKLGSVNGYAVAALSKVTSTAQGMGQGLTPSEPADGTNELPFSVRRAFLSGQPTASVWWHVRHPAGGARNHRHRDRAGGVFPGPREDLRDRFIHLVAKAT